MSYLPGAPFVRSSLGKSMNVYMDFQIRMAAFKWLEEQVLLHGDILPRTILEQGFVFNGQRITLMGPQDIWKPKVFELPLSITTVADGPYDNTILRRIAGISPPGQ